ncbi:hypothetical protein AVEN_221763-1 [Araneus ventricosus]|uniref:Uncharacterized protein n=1 Tax=Araneus ventricosus TaxID=182803 RepID=A0A4Y2FME6_ARAVE|nr:hypothetical protein AVEN_221763-1 [Araneus ventricosus]
MFSPGRELFSFSKEPIFRLTARLVERHAFALRARYGCHGNRPPLHFTSGPLPLPLLLAPSKGDAVHKFEAPFWSPPTLGDCQQIYILIGPILRSLSPGL